jgi:hypothetical protein
MYVATAATPVHPNPPNNLSALGPDERRMQVKNNVCGEILLLLERSSSRRLVQFPKLAPISRTAVMAPMKKRTAWFRLSHVTSSRCLNIAPHQFAHEFLIRRLSVPNLTPNTADSPYKNAVGTGGVYSYRVAILK